MATACILSATVGLVLLIAALARIVPELILDSPGELFLSLFSRRSNFFALISSYIREGWPHTKFDALLFYGGQSMLILAAVGYWVVPELLELSLIHI